MAPDRSLYQISWR